MSPFAIGTQRYSQQYAVFFNKNLIKYIIKITVEEWLLMLTLAYIVECQRSKYYSFQPQNMVFDLNSKKRILIVNFDTIEQILKHLDL
jgi:hypothetical protein